MMHIGIGGRQGNCESASDLHEMPDDALAYVVGKMDVRQRFLYSLTGRTAWRLLHDPVLWREVDLTPCRSAVQKGERTAVQKGVGGGEGLVPFFCGVGLKRMWGLGQLLLDRCSRRQDPLQRS
jgi:hypothetical protein